MIIAAIVASFSRHADESVQVQLSLKGTVARAFEEAWHDFTSKGFSVMHLEGSPVRHPGANIAVTIRLGAGQHDMQLRWKVLRR